MYTALYRTERPENFDQVLGQEHIVRILRNQVKSGTVGHAYLFCGTRGTGKTSVARILAKAVNCTGEEEGLLEPGSNKPCCKCANCQAIQAGNFLDVIEIDAASNNGVDNVRELRESVNYPPSVGKRKVYIIDEAHELTTHALNALLKTLEEPPENVMFILATTDPQKLIQTILSRCLRLDFHRISEAELKRHMYNICAKRNVEITDDALNLLTANADGSARDALSLLDQCLSGGEAKLDRDTILEYLGAVSDDFFIRLTDNVSRGDAASGLIMLDEVLRDGKDVKQILSDWMGHYRSLLIGKFIASPENILNMSGENVARLSEQAKALSLDEINRGIMTLAETVNNARYSPQPRVLMELAIVTLAAGEGGGLAASTPRTKEPQANLNRSEGKPAVASVKPVEVQPQTQPQTIANGEVKAEVTAQDNLSDIWLQVWDRIDDLGSVTMVRINSTLAGISETEFKLLVTNRLTLNIAEKNRKPLEEAMEGIVGRPLKMILKEAKPEDLAKDVGVQESLFPNSEALIREEEDLWDAMPEANPEKGETLSDEELKKEIESKFNIEVRIEE